MNKSTLPQIDVFVRVTAVNSDSLMVQYLHGGSLCSRCLSLGYCVSKRVSWMSHSMMPVLSIPRLVSCQVGNVLRVSLPRNNFLVSFLLMFFFPTFIFLVVAIFSESLHLGEWYIFLLSWLSLFLALLLVRFCLSRCCLKCVVSCEKVDPPYVNS